MGMPLWSKYRWSFDEDVNEGPSSNAGAPRSPASSTSSFDETPAAFTQSPTTESDVTTNATEALEDNDLVTAPADANQPLASSEIIAAPARIIRHFKDYNQPDPRSLTIDVKEIWQRVFNWARWPGGIYGGLRSYISEVAGYGDAYNCVTIVPFALARIPADDAAGLRNLVDTLEIERDDTRDHLNIAFEAIDQIMRYDEDEWHKQRAEVAGLETELEHSKIQHEKELADSKTAMIALEKELQESKIAHLRAELELNESKLDIRDLERSCDRHLENNTVLFEKLQDAHMAFEYHDNLTAGYRDIAARQVENLKGQLRRANARIEEVEEVLGRLEEEVEREVDEEWVDMIQRMDVGAECVGRVNRRRRMVGEEEGMMRG